MPTLDDKEIIAEAMKFWDEAQSDPNRANWEYDLNFASGEHWDPDMKDMRARSNRPCLVIDRLHVHCKNISNRIRQERPSMSVSPVDDAGDVETADVFRGVFRHIESISMSTEQYAQAAETQVSAGVGYLRAYVDGGEIYNTVVDDIFSVALDPLSRNVFGLDAAWGMIVETVDRKQMETDYPDASISDWPSLSNWMNDDEISRCEYFRVERQETGEPGVTWYLLTSGGVLEKRALGYGYIPIVRVPGEVIKKKGQKLYRGIEYRGMDAQKMYDYYKSSEAESIALAPKSPYLAADGQLDNFMPQWLRANVDNIPVLFYKTQDAAGNLVGRPSREPPPQASTLILQGVAGAAEDIRGTTGQHAPSRGSSQPGQSGVAVNALASEGDTATYHFVDHMRGAITVLAIIDLDMIPRVYGMRQIVRMIGEDDERSFAKLDPMMPAASEEREINGKIERIYNLQVGTYDVVAGTGKNFATKRTEAQDFIQKIVGTAPELWKVLGDELIRLADVEGGKVMAERLKRTIPPEILYSREELRRKQFEEQASGEQDGGPGAEGQAMMAQAQEQMAAMQQAMQQMEQQAALMDERLKRTQAEVRLKEAMIQRENEAGELAGEKMGQLAAMQQQLAQEIMQHVERQPIVIQVAPPPPTRTRVLISPAPGGKYAAEIFKEPVGEVMEQEAQGDSPAVVVQAQPPPPTRATVLMRAAPGGKLAGELIKEPMN
jgi:hypothetical protein